MLSRRLIVLFVLFFSIILTCFSQSDGKTVGQLFTEKGVTEEIQRLTNDCWRLREVNSDSALVLGKRALDLAIKNNIQSELPRIYGFLGVIQLHYLYQTKASIPNLQNALKYSLQQKDSVQLAYSYNNLGDLYLMTGNVPLSLRYSEYSVGMFEKLNHPTGKSYSYVNIGLVYREKKEFDLALSYFKKAADLWDELGDQVGIGSVYREIARTYAMKGDLDLAMNYYQKSYSMGIKAENGRYAAFCLNGMANIYYQRKEYEKAREYYTSAIELNKKQNHDFGLVDNYKGIALVKAQEGKQKEEKNIFNLQ